MWSGYPISADLPPQVGWYLLMSVATNLSGPDWVVQRQAIDVRSQRAAHTGWLSALGS
ncbi:hypothetical protein GCM10011609_84770 [Lentzea pudingi]|uniref:Uncharacterized protein n=1 Tax=Lentzea pudingi TaxID=1789439 RepID=A0ABQ2IRX0_9PSEU|nr:hypothetical protein GCM10011609_84770 [Lentzea pudingi]